MAGQSVLPIEVDFAFGETVYRKVEDDRRPGMITGYTVRPYGHVIYRVTWQGGNEDACYGMELTREYTPSYA